MSNTAESPALAMVRQIAAVEAAAPLVFAGAHQLELIARAVGELHLARTRALGTALRGAGVRASGAWPGSRWMHPASKFSCRSWARPRRVWRSAGSQRRCHGRPLRSQLAPHVLSALNARIPTLWPPGPLALASAAARVVEAIVHGSRRQFSCLVSLDAGPLRNSVAAMPVEVGPRGVVRVLEPALTRQERTQMENAIEQAQRGI